MKNWNWVYLLVPPCQQGESPTYEPLKWVKSNCPTYITNDAVQKNGEYYYRFYFQANAAGDRDRTMFLLRWS
jgi:hypothetical protein